METESRAQDRSTLKGLFEGAGAGTLEAVCGALFGRLCCLLGREALFGTFFFVFLCVPGKGKSLVGNIKHLPLQGVAVRHSLELMSLSVCVILMSVTVCATSVCTEFGTAGNEAWIFMVSGSGFWV